MQKWGFGAAPLKEKQENRYKYIATIIRWLRRGKLRPDAVIYSNPD